MCVRFRRDEQGIALITVLAVITILSTLAITSLSYATGSLDLSRRDQDWNAALAAAEAGVDDYVLHLNQDGNYYNYSATSPDPAPPDGNMAFTGWVKVPGPANPASFRYTRDKSTIGVDGNIRVTSTGRVGKVTRSVESVVRRRNFLDYLYFTDYETLDPANYPRFSGDWSATVADTNCRRHQWGSPARDAGCTNIQFFGGSTRQDVINGPLHTNDTIRINGTPWFKGPTTTSWDDPAGKRWFDTTGSSAPIFAATSDPKYAGRLELPPSNSSLVKFTNAAPAANGCLFTGPTKIKLLSNGRAQITSPFTKSSNCLTGSQTSSTFTIDIPSDQVFYVQGIPAATSDPNYTSTCSFPTGFLPVENVDDDGPDYKCRDGDVFLSGVLKGQLTIGSANNIVIIGDTTYDTAPPGGSDVLGLIANNFVEIYHPVTSAGANISYSGGPTTKLDAALLAVAHSFRVQRHNRGAVVGNLTVRGAIGQVFRGPVGIIGGSGTLSNGYAKDYSYDTRLKYISPPHFIDPLKSVWLVRSYAEIKKQY